MPKIQRIPIVVTFTKGNRKKIHMKVFKDLRSIDDILVQDTKLLPTNAKIQQVGIGSSFEKRYKSKK